MVTNQEKYDHGSYLNLLKPFEFSIHNLTDKMEKTGLFVESLDDSDSFEEVYQKTLRNCERLLDAKLDVTRRGGQIFHKVDRFPIFSSTLLKRIPCVNDVINSMASLDGSTMAANSVVNIILPNNISVDNCTAFLYAIAGSAIQSLQLNCTSREELLDAQKHPEKYPDLIVRVTGFSAKFTCLSSEWQEEVITRNFYK